MNDTFDIAVEFVLSQEGGLADDPQDMGGLTNYGISHTNYPMIDIAHLTRDDAKTIYKRDYWDACSCGLLPDGLAIVLLDAAVNQGPLAGRRMLQQALNVKQDGVIGPMTQQAAMSADVKKTVSEFVARRINTYGLNPQFTRYGLGWARRCVLVHQIALEAI